MADIFDLDSMVQDWAFNTFLKTSSHGKMKLGDIAMETNWSKVSFESTDATFDDKKMQILPQAQVVYKSTYTNNTDKDQEHTFSANRSTTSTSKASITKGFTKGVNLGLKLAVPGEVASITPTFGYSVSLSDVSDNSNEKSVSWSSECRVTVPPKKKVTAQLDVTEKEFTGTFSFKTKIGGRVLVSIHRRSNNEFLQTVEGSFSEIACNHFDRVIRQDKPFKVDKTTIIWEVQGKCSFRFGVEQMVQVNPCLTSQH